MTAVRTRLSILVPIVALLAAPAAAQTYVERPYNPPVGSKWQIVSNTTTAENRPGAGNRDERIESRSELTIDEKLPEGFRVTYTNRGIDVSGNALATKLVADAYAAMRDIPVRARLDKAGRPVEIENLAEIKKTMSGVVDKIVAKFDGNPKAAAVIRQMFRALLDVEGRDAATTYLEELPQLAAVQNIGLQPGNVRKDTETNPSPFGNVTFKTNLTTRLDTYDAKTGAARFVRKREYDKDALRDAVTEIVRKLAAAGDNKTITSEMVDMMKKINFSIEGEAIYNVDNGMTVWIDDREFTTASVMGTTFTKQQKKTVAVRRQN
jgi:hypothetical protein